MAAQHDPTHVMNDRASSAPGAGAGLARYLEEHWQIATALGALVIIVATLIAYIPAMRGGFVWDDDYYVTNNRLLTSWDGLQKIWFGILPHPTEYDLPQYYPMTHTSFWVEYRIWGLDPIGYHVVNVSLHIINALLVWLLLRKLSVPGAWLAAVLFALHPINVESVAWIAERKNVLSLMFFLSSLYVYLRYAGIIQGEPPPAKPVEPVDDQQDIIWFKLPDDPQRLYALAVILFLCALFTKTVTYCMPAVALVIIFWKRRGKLAARDVLPLLPLFAAGVLMGMLTSYMEKYSVGVAIRTKPWHYADTPVLDFGARCIIAGRAIWFYLGKLAWPADLRFNYPRWAIDPTSAAQYVSPLAALAVIIVVLALRKRLGGWGTVAAMLIFLGTLFPALGFFDVWPMQYSFVADHFVYISSIAFFALVAALLVRYLPMEVVGGLAAIAIVGYAALSFQQSKQYKDADTLWITTWNKSGKTSWMAANNFGGSVFDRDISAAEAWFNAAVKLRPDYSEARLNLAKVSAAKALALKELIALGATSQAATQSAASTTSRAASTLPQLAIPTTQTSEDFYADAIRRCREIIADEPQFVEAHLFLGKLLLTTGQVEQAKEQFRECIKLLPRNLEARLALGQLALQENDLPAAAQYFYDAAVMHPDSAEAHSLLGRVMLQQGKATEGLIEWQSAMRLEPQNWRLPMDFGARLADAGQYAAAVPFFKEAVSINPRAAEPRIAFGVVAAKAGFPVQAKDLFNQALEIEPNNARAKEMLEALASGRLKPTTTRASTAPSSTSSPARSQ
jgi:Tfp pilus assembly protein PilF